MLIALVNCIQKHQVEDTTTEIQTNSGIVTFYSQTDNHYDNSDNDTYVHTVVT